jgi:hypothetical protein
MLQNPYEGRWKVRFAHLYRTCTIQTSAATIVEVSPIFDSFRPHVYATATTCVVVCCIVGLATAALPKLGKME